MLMIKNGMIKTYLEAVLILDGEEHSEVER